MEDDKMTTATVGLLFIGRELKRAYEAMIDAGCDEDVALLRTVILGLDIVAAIIDHGSIEKGDE